MKTIALRERRDTQLRFNQRELAADALSWTSAEGQVHEFRPIPAAFGQEALRIERFRVLPECGKPVQNVDDDKLEPSAE